MRIKENEQKFRTFFRNCAWKTGENEEIVKKVIRVLYLGLSSSCSQEQVKLPYDLILNLEHN